MFSSTLGDGLQYTPSSCFETFPFPEGYETNLSLERAGESYYIFRSKLMADRDVRIDYDMHPSNPEGMTKTYTHFHNPNCHTRGIIKLRELHANMDRAVADAYGWDDLELTYDWIDHYSGLTLQERYQELRDDKEVPDLDFKKHVKPRYTFTSEVKDEVMKRLLTLNEQRKREEDKSRLDRWFSLLSIHGL